MKLTFTLTAQKQFTKLQKTEVKKIIRKLDQLANDPYSGKKLQGEFKDEYSLRAWPFRIIYRLLDNTIEIHLIEHRQSVYK